MRTALAIDDDILAATKGVAARQKKTLGEAVSELARQPLLDVNVLGRPGACPSRHRARVVHGKWPAQLGNLPVDRIDS